MTAFLGSLRVVSRTAGVTFLERAIPLYAGLMLASAVLFGPSGVDPRDVAALAHSSLGARVVLWSAWLVLSAPLVGVLLRDRRGDFLRSLPISRWWPFGAFVLWLLASQVPWALFWALAEGPIGGVRALVLGAGAAVLVSRRPRDVVEGAALCGVVVALGAGGGPLASLMLTPLLVLATKRVWARAPERPATRGSWVRGPGMVALATAYALRLTRVERVGLLRSALVSLLGGVVAALVVKNGDSSAGEPAVFLAALAPALVLAISPWIAPMREAERGLDVIVRSSGLPEGRRRNASRLVAVAAGVVTATLAIAAAQRTAPISFLSAALGVLFGAVLGPFVVGLERWVRRPRVVPRDEGGRVLVALGGIAVASSIAAFTLGGWLVAALAILGVVRALLDVQRMRKTGPFDAAALLSIRDVRKRFGGKVVLKGMSMEIERGTVAVLRGENGSGKSTLLRLVAGLLEPDGGGISIGGHSLATERTEALRCVGYAPDAGELPDHLSVEELVTLVGSLKAASRDLEQEAELGVTSLLGERLGALSLGQRRRVGIATALVGAPALLVLDEPTNGLDASGLEVLFDVLAAQRSRGAALVASHEANFAAMIADVQHAMAT